METARGILLLLVWITSFRLTSCSTNPQDAAALRALMSELKNMPPSWSQSDDPCGSTPWSGVTCENSRVTVLKLFNMGLEGTLSSDIRSLTALQTLDLSYNKLGGTLTSAIGNLKQLTALKLIGCNFSGPIPNELGNLSNLTFLALNSNQFTGNIPASLGSLSKLRWLDLAENQLSGALPVSTKTSPGLDQLFDANHFHLNMNQLSGQIPENLFNSNMKLLHVLLDKNQLTGTIPASIGQVQTLTVLRLDDNSLSGSVPSNISNLLHLDVLNLANNKLTGPMPNLSGMNALKNVDLSNNSFDPSEVPSWISEIETLQALVIESGGLHGEVPQKLFSHPNLQQVILNNNSFNGTLDMGSNISMQLHAVNFQNNALSSVVLSSNYNNTIILVGNPVCSNGHLSLTSYCVLEQQSLQSLANCDPQSCSQINNCSHPYKGVMFFRAPYFRDVRNDTVFQQLEKSVWAKYGANLGSVSLQNPFFGSDSYLQVDLILCPLNGGYFNRTLILTGLDFSSETYSAPEFFGPYYFSANTYVFPGKSSLSTGVIVGIVVGAAVLVLGLVGVAIYALRQKKRAQRAIEISDPFASWVPNGEDDGGAPQLKGARWFSYEELKKCTNNFPKINEIGSGGYGKVYRGMLSDGQIVAIKRSQVGSSQGGLEFKTEIELLSRVHHKNLVELVGFCFQQGERMLVYEFIPNGNLRENLSGKNGVQLNWNRRLRIALGSASGLAYLHDLANPPIIHRDVKSANILLDEKLNAKVADFGLSKLVADSEIGLVSTQVKGTLGYLDPEYYTTQQLTDRSDVYSFGVVMLELVTARPPIHNNKYIVREVQIAIDKNDNVYYGLKEIMDPVIRDATDLVGFRRFVELAMQCVAESSVHRPRMKDIVKEIDMILQTGGSNIDSSSTASSARDFETPNSAPRHHYNDQMARKDVSNNLFEYSGGYSFSVNLEPK